MFVPIIRSDTTLHCFYYTRLTHPCPLLSSLQEFTSYLQKHDEVLTELEKATKRLKKLETVYKEFELQKVCYLPLNTFLLKPIQRLMHYKLILERLCHHYTPEQRDHDDCKGERVGGVVGKDWAVLH